VLETALEYVQPIERERQREIVVCAHFGFSSRLLLLFLQWITYGILKQDLFIFFANAPGLLMAIWLNLQAVKLQYDSFRSQETRTSILQALEHEMATSSELFLMDAAAPNSSLSRIVSKVTAPAMMAPAHHDHLVMLNAIVWLIVIAIISYGTALTQTTQEYIVGITVNLNLVVFYASPLFVIWTVLQQRNSISIHIPTMVTNTLNGSFWAAYGIAILDPFIAVPNGLGASLGGVQILLCVLFPRRPEADESLELITASAPPTESSPPVMEVAPTQASH
jgi:solute carrier family 50 protein (sugar transporter)